MLWSAQLVSLTGRQLTLVAVPYQLYQLTGSSLVVGTLGLVQAVPMVFAGLYAGAVADRFDRKRVILLAVLGQMLCSALLFAGAAHGHPSVAFLYAVTAASAPLSTVEGAARSASIPRIVGIDRLASAMSLWQVLIQVAQVAGPALAGVIIGIDLRWAYLADTLCYLVALAGMFGLPALPPLEGLPRVSLGLKAPVEGLAFAFRERAVLAIFAIDLVAMIFGMPRALFPALAAHTFHAGPQGLGLLYSGPALGALVGTLMSGGLTRSAKPGRAVIAAVVAWGAAITAFGFSGGRFAVAIVLLALAGSADVLSAIYRHTILQTLTPDHLRGRASALNSMVVTVGPRLGDLEAGAVAAFTSPFFSVVSGGVLCVAGAVVVAWRLPELARLRYGQSAAATGSSRS